MPSEFDMLRVRRILGRDAWAAPTRYGPTGRKAST